MDILSLAMSKKFTEQKSSETIKNFTGSSRNWFDTKITVVDIDQSRYQSENDAYFGPDYVYLQDYQIRFMTANCYDGSFVACSVGYKRAGSNMTSLESVFYMNDSDDFTTLYRPNAFFKKYCSDEDFRYFRSKYQDLSALEVDSAVELPGKNVLVIMRDENVYNTEAKYNDTLSLLIDCAHHRIHIIKDLPIHRLLDKPLTIGDTIIVSPSTKENFRPRYDELVAGWNDSFDEIYRSGDRGNTWNTIKLPHKSFYGKIQRVNDIVFLPPYNYMRYDDHNSLSEQDREQYFSDFLIYSEDEGKSWKECKLPFLCMYDHLQYANGMYVIMSYGGGYPVTAEDPIRYSCVMTSTDLQSWNVSKIKGDDSTSRAFRTTLRPLYVEKTYWIFVSSSTLGSTKIPYSIDNLQTIDFKNLTKSWQSYGRYEGRTELWNTAGITEKNVRRNDGSGARGERYNMEALEGQKVVILPTIYPRKSGGALKTLYFEHRNIPVTLEAGSGASVTDYDVGIVLGKGKRQAFSDVEFFEDCNKGFLLWHPQMENPDYMGWTVRYDDYSDALENTYVYSMDYGINLNTIRVDWKHKPGRFYRKGKTCIIVPNCSEKGVQACNEKGLDGEGFYGKTDEILVSKDCGMTWRVEKLLNKVSYRYLSVFFFSEDKVIICPEIPYYPTVANMPISQKSGQPVLSLSTIPQLPKSKVESNHIIGYYAGNGEPNRRIDTYETPSFVLIKNSVTGTVGSGVISDGGFFPGELNEAGISYQYACLYN